MFLLLCALWGWTGEGEVFAGLTRSYWSAKGRGWNSEGGVGQGWIRVNSLWTKRKLHLMFFFLIVSWLVRNLTHVIASTLEFVEHLELFCRGTYVQAVQRSDKNESFLVMVSRLVSFGQNVTQRKQLCRFL